MIERYTKQERNAIYRQALIESETDNPPYGLCTWLIWAIRRIEGRFCAHIDMPYFPEIMKHLPRKKFGTAYWFDSKDKQIRIDILNQAIKETE